MTALLWTLGVLAAWLLIACALAPLVGHCISTQPAPTEWEQSPYTRRTPTDVPEVEEFLEDDDYRDKP